MKKLIIAAFLFIGTLTISQSKAQVGVGISINIGSQPAWGPTGYDYVQNYYLPAYNCYYDVVRQQFIYLNRGRWIYASTLPAIYGNVNLFNTYKVVVNRANPYLNNAADIRAYGKYKNVHTQTVIRDSKDRKYYQNSGNRYHSQWKGDNRGGGGRR